MTEAPPARWPRLYPMLKKAGVPTEIHVYASGGKRFGIREKPNRQTPVATSWYLRLGDWMADQLADRGLA